MYLMVRQRYFPQYKIAVDCDEDGHTNRGSQAILKALKLEGQHLNSSHGGSVASGSTSTRIQRVSLLQELQIAL